GYGADRESDVSPSDAVDVYGDLGPLEGLEALLAGFEAVDTRGQVGEVETTRPVGNSLARQAGTLVDGDDGGAPDGSARGVFDIAEDRSIQNLCAACLGEGKDHDQGCQRQTRQQDRPSACFSGHRKLQR